MWGFGKIISSLSGALVNRISAFIKRTSESSLILFLACEDTVRNYQSATRRRALTNPCWLPDLGLQAFLTVRNTCLFFISHSVYDILLSQPELTKKYRALPAYSPRGYEEVSIWSYSFY